LERLADLSHLFYIPNLQIDPNPSFMRRVLVLNFSGGLKRRVLNLSGNDAGTIFYAEDGEISTVGQDGKVDIRCDPLFTLTLARLRMCFYCGGDISLRQVSRLLIGAGLCDGAEIIP